MIQSTTEEPSKNNNVFSYKSGYQEDAFFFLDVMTP